MLHKVLDILIILMRAEKFFIIVFQSFIYNSLIMYLLLLVWFRSVYRGARNNLKQGRFLGFSTTGYIRSMEDRGSDTTKTYYPNNSVTSIILLNATLLHTFKISIIVRNRV